MVITKIYDYSDSDDTFNKKRINPFEQGFPELSFTDAYLFNMFNAVREIEKSIMEMRSTHDYRPYLLMKLLCSMVIDRGERARLLSDLQKTYNRVLQQTKIQESDLLYPDSVAPSQKQRTDLFWWNLTDACLPIVGEIHSYLDRALNIAQRNEIWEA